MTQTDSNLLFVYGTLLSQADDDMGRPMRARLAQEARLLGSASINGQLLDFGAYPGLIVDSEADDLVHGEVVELRDPAASLVWLDEYEGISSNRPYANEYERVLRQVSLAGTQVTAWIYLRTNVPATGYTVIAGGCWLPRTDTT